MEILMGMHVILMMIMMELVSSYSIVAICCIRELVDSLCRDGADTPISRI